MSRARKEEDQCLDIGDIILAGLVALAKLCVAMAVEEARRQR